MGNTKSSYKSLKEKHVESGKLYKDKRFPCVSSSLCLKARNKQVIWKRPKEICKDPQLIVDGTSCSDVNQGQVGNCWFLSAVISLVVTNEEIFNKVIPTGQDFCDNYAGIFRFNFFVKNKWREVVVDDFLPTEDGELIYCHNVTQPNEFWCPLLEKAYAKMFKSYQGLQGGTVSDAMVSITGGTGDVIYLCDETHSGIIDILTKGHENRSLMVGDVLEKSSDAETVDATDLGLFIKHAYTIADLVEVKYKEENVKLLQLRNPWGRLEWTGAWSDGDSHWDDLCAEDKEKIHRTVEDDGDFWICMDDFIKYFDAIELCHLKK